MWFRTSHCRTCSSASKRRPDSPSSCRTCRACRWTSTSSSSATTWRAMRPCSRAAQYLGDLGLAHGRGLQGRCAGRACAVGGGFPGRRRSPGQSRRASRTLGWIRLLKRRASLSRTSLLSGSRPSKWVFTLLPRFGALPGVKGRDSDSGRPDSDWVQARSCWRGSGA